MYFFLTDFQRILQQADDDIFPNATYWHFLDNFVRIINPDLVIRQICPESKPSDSDYIPLFLHSAQRDHRRRRNVDVFLAAEAEDFYNETLSLQLRKLLDWSWQEISLGDLSASFIKKLFDLLLLSLWHLEVHQHPFTLTLNIVLVSKKY